MRYVAAPPLFRIFSKNEIFCPYLHIEEQLLTDVLLCNLFILSEGILLGHSVFVEYNSSLEMQYPVISEYFVKVKIFSGISGMRPKWRIADSELYNLVIIFIFFIKFATKYLIGRKFATNILNIK